MENEKVLEGDHRYMPWEEFKERYLSKVNYLGEILGLDRDEVIMNVKESFDEEDSEENNMDDHYLFLSGVVDHVLDWEGKGKKKPLFNELRKTDDAEAIFYEIHYLWVFRAWHNGELFFERESNDTGRRSEPGKGDLIDIFMMDRSSGRTCLTRGMGEDFAECDWPVVLKMKQNACISTVELAKLLRDLADALDEDFNNCHFHTLRNYYVVPEIKDQAILCGLHESDPKFYRHVYNKPRYPFHESIKEAGWIDPNLSLENGVGVMLQKGWSELYEKVLKGEISPFEALLETDHVHPRDVYEALTSNAETQKVDEEQLEHAEQVDDSNEQLLQELEEL